MKGEGMQQKLFHFKRSAEEVNSGKGNSQTSLLDGMCNSKTLSQEAGLQPYLVRQSGSFIVSNYMT